MTRPVSDTSPAPNGDGEPEHQPLSDDEFKERLVETMSHLRAFARSLAHDHATADGIVQDTLLKAWAARDSYIPTKPMRAWTFVILRNTFYSRFRRQKFTGEYSEETAEKLLTVEPAQEDPLHIADLHDALMELTESQREAIILVGAGGFSYQEAAEIVGCAEGTIKSRVSRAREGLVVILQRKFASRKSKSAKLSGSAAYEKIIEAVGSYTKAD